MTPSRARRFLAMALALAAATTACGLKPDAVQSLKTSAGASGATGTGGAAAGAPAATDTGPGGANAASGGSTSSSGLVAAGSGSAGSGSTNGITTTSAGGGGSTTGTVTSGAAGGTTACGTPHGGSTTGVTSGTINIGLHAPLTGTGTPFPNNSFQAGAATFWKQAGHTVCGRHVNVEFQDDTYTPAHARQVCSAMAQRDFLVVGGGGTDQIQACATEPHIHQNNVPYLSAGVTDNGLAGLANYFAVSLTYKQQGVLVLRNAQQQGFATPLDSQEDSDNIHGAKAKWAIVTANTPNFAGARDGMKAALNAAHIPYKSFEVDQNSNYQAAATQFGRTLAQSGFKTIYVDAAPGYFVFMTGGYYTVPAAQANWVGPGVTYTEVTVAQYICSGSKAAVSGHAWFLAPTTGIDRATSDFKAAYNGKYDDIEWTLWGLSHTLWVLLKNASDNLTRQNFLATSATSVVTGGPYVPVDFRSHGGHFGGTGAWVQRVNCAEIEPNQNEPGQWDTVGSDYLRLF